MGFGVNNDRRGFSDPWDSPLKAAEAPRAVVPNPVPGQSTKPSPPFVEIEIAGRKYTGYPWRETGRIVLPADGTNTAAGSLAIAEGLAAAESSTIAAICSFDVPADMIAVVLRVRVRMGDNLALQHVKVQLVAGGTQSSSPQSGDSGMAVAGKQQSFLELDDAVPVNFRARQNTRIKLLAINTDTEVPHYIEGEMEGVYFPASMLAPLGPEKA